MFVTNRFEKTEGKYTMDVNGAAWIQIFFKISSFLFSIRKKFIQVWNNLRVSK